MTITGSYPTDSVGQKAFLETVKQTYRNIESQTSLVTVHGTNEPSDSVLKAQWAAQIPYAPPTNGSQLNWFNPSTGKVEQVYVPVIGSGGNIAPYRKKPTNSGLDFLGEVVATTPSQLAFTPPVGYRHLLITYSVRATTAGVGIETILLKLNANVTATHTYIFWYMLNASNPVLGTNSVLTSCYVGAMPLAGTTNPSQCAVGHIWLPNYSVDVTTQGRRYWMGESAWSNGNTRPYVKNHMHFWGWSPAVGVLSTVTLLGNGTAALERGSKMSVWGLK